MGVGMFFFIFFFIFFHTVHIENSSHSLGEIPVRERDTNKQLRGFI